MPAIIPLIYLGILATLLMLAVGGWGIGIAVFLVLLYALLREAPKSHIVDQDPEPEHGHAEP